MTRPNALTAVPFPRSYLVSQIEIDRLHEKVVALQQKVEALARILHDLDSTPIRHTKHRGLHLVHSAKV